MRTRSVISLSTGWEDAGRVPVGDSLGTQLAYGIAAKDEAGLRALFSTPVTFRAVTPSRFWDAETSVGVVDIVLGTWFGPDKTIIDVASVDSATVNDVEKVSYRMTVELPSGPAVIEQVAYYSQRHGRICEMRLVSSGIRPV